MDEQEKKLKEKYGKLPMKKNMLSGMKVRLISLPLTTYLTTLKADLLLNNNVCRNESTLIRVIMRCKRLVWQPLIRLGLLELDKG